MKICVETKSSLELFSKKLSNFVFEALDESGPLMVIVDSDGNQHNNNQEIFIDIFHKNDDLNTITARVADGHDPLRCEVNGYNVYASQVHADKNGNVFAIVAVCGLKSGAEECLAEAVLGQVELAATLLEKTSRARSAYPVIANEELPYVLN